MIASEPIAEEPLTGRNLYYLFDTFTDEVIAESREPISPDTCNPGKASPYGLIAIALPSRGGDGDKFL